MSSRSRLVTRSFRLLVVASLLLTSVPASTGTAARASALTFDSPLPAPEGDEPTTFDSPLPTPVPSVPVGEAVTGTFTPAGGELTSLDGRVRVVAPAGALTTNSAVTLKTQTMQLAQEQMGAALRFSLDPDMQFARPVTVAVNLQGLIPLENLPAGWWPYLAYLEDPVRGEWQRVPLKEIDWETGIVTAQLEHFSEYESGVVSENGWLLSFNDAVVDGFRGAMSYQIPLQVPPGRGGLQPSLTLAYNSDRINGILANVQSDWMGLGWSLDAPQIVRNVHLDSNGQVGTDTSHPNYTLVMGGKGYTLVPDPSVDPNEAPNQGVGRYYTDEEAFFYIEKRATQANDLETYWTVKTGDGTLYEFGHTTDAEQVLCNVAYLGQTVYRWRLNRIVDVWGNEVVFEYQEEVDDPFCQRASYLAAIKYNEKANGEWGTQILFGLRSRLSDPDGTEQGDYLFFQQKHLDNVQVRQDGQLVRKYQLGYDFSGESRRLQSVTEYGSDGSALPTMTFEYQVYDNTSLEWGNGNTYPYSRLSGVDNGYSGRIEIDYQQAIGKADSYYHYRVLERRTLDGLGNTSRRTYSYGPACMDATDSKCDDGYRSWGLKGYEWSTEETRDYDESALNKTTSSFVLAWPLTGRVGAREVTDDQDELQQRTETGWGYDWLIPSTVDYTTGVAFFHVDALTETMVSTTITATTRTDYNYDEYGNLEWEFHWGNTALSGDETLVWRSFYPNEENWLVSLPAQEQVSAGMWSPVLRETRYFYDGQNWNEPPTSGELTQMQVGGGDLWATTLYEHDPYGNPTAVTDPLGRTTRTRYDDLYHLYPISATNSLDQTTLTAWDAGLGAPAQVTDPNGASVRYGYDPFGRLVSVTKPDPETGAPGSEPDLTYTYPTPGGNGQVAAPFTIETAQRLGTGLHHRVWTLYDGLGRALQTQEAAEGGKLALTHTGYDARGLAARQSLPVLVSGTGGVYAQPDWGGLRVTATGYDALGRAVQVTAPDGATTRYAYRGWHSLTLDPNGHQTISEQDGLGRTVAVRECAGEWTQPNWDAAGAETHYWYSALGQLVAVQDSEENVTRMAYDTLGRKIKMQDPSMGHWRYEYDLAGNLIAQTDALSQTITFQYDDLNRMMGKYAGERVLAEYGYDAGAWGVGRRAAMTDTTGVATWTYDGRGRVVAETRVLTQGLGSYTTGFQYDAADRVRGIEYPASDEVVSTNYDARGLVESVAGYLEGDVWSYLSGATYGAAGQVTLQNWGNGLATSYDYRADNLRLERSWLAGESTSLLDLRYTYDLAGNVATLDDVERGETATFDYDERDRLVSAGGPYQETYAYSPMGNVLTRTVEGEARGYAYGETVVISQTESPPPGGLQVRAYMPLVARISGPAYPQPPDATTGQPFAVQAQGGNRYAYDANGNMVLRVVAGDAETTIYAQEFDVENRLTGVEAQTRPADWTLDLEEYQIQSYGGSQDQDSTVTVEDGGATLHIVGNGWKKIAFPYSVTPDTILELDFKSGAQGEIHGIGFDTNNGISPGSTFKLYGTESWGIEAFDDYGTAAPGWKHYQIPVGQFYTGAMLYLVFANDHDVGEPTAESFFANLQVYESSDVESTHTAIGYSGEGARVWQTSGLTTTLYLGDLMEVAIGPGGRITRTYYYAGGQRIGVRVSEDSYSQLYYLHTDHLGSTSLAIYGQARPLYPRAYLPIIFRSYDGGGALPLAEGGSAPLPFDSPLPLPEKTVADGSAVVLATTFASPIEPPTPGEPLMGSETRYRPFGEVRTEEPAVAGLTAHTFTGQSVDEATGLMYYGARWYDPSLGRFISADTIVPQPGNPQDFNRYSYARNNALKYIDPSGHSICEGWDCQEPEMPSGWPPSIPGHSRPATPATASPEVYWTLLANELGPRDEQNTLLISALFNPWPDLSESDPELVTEFYFAKESLLYNVYGGPTGLMQKVVGACTTDHCNNPWLDTSSHLDTDYWVNYSMDDRRFITGGIVGEGGTHSPQGYFLREVKASSDLANFEAWWLSELMRQHPQELLRAQGRWVMEVYLVDYEVWHQFTRGGWGGWRVITTDVPPPSLQ